MSVSKKDEIISTVNARVESARTELKSAVEKLQASAKTFADKVEAKRQNLREEFNKVSEKARTAGFAATAKTATESATASAKDLATRTVGVLGLASNDDLVALNKKIDTLSRKLKKLEKTAA